jgi:hypothetical protein
MTPICGGRASGSACGLHLQYPKASFAAQQPAPSWEAWLPSAVTACLLVGALAVAALRPRPVRPRLVAAAARHAAADPDPARAWGLGARAVEPGPVRDRLAARRHRPVDDLVLAGRRDRLARRGAPGDRAGAVVLRRRPRLYPGEVAARLLPLAVAGVAVIAWNHAAGEPPDWPTYALRAAWVLAGALLLSGGLPVRVTILAAGAPARPLDRPRPLEHRAGRARRAGVRPGRLGDIRHRPRRRRLGAGATEGGAGRCAASADRWTAMVADMDEPVRRRARAAPAGAGGRHRA